MSIWSILGKIGAGVAAPFTGGASLAAIPAIDALGNIGQDTTALEQGRAAGRVQQAGINNNQDAMRQRAAQLLEQALNDRANQQYRNAQFSLAAPGAEMGNAARGDAMANLQDAGISGPTIHTRGQVPQITGGLRPSLLSANSRQLGSNISRDMLMRNMSGADNLPSMPAPQIPSVTPSPNATGLDTGLNLTGLAGGLAPDIMDFVNKFKQKPDQVYPQVFPDPFGNNNNADYGNGAG